MFEDLKLQFKDCKFEFLVLVVVGQEEVKLQVSKEKCKLQTYIAHSSQNLMENLNLSKKIEFLAFAQITARESFVQLSD